jgi:hypothetical protein
VAPVGTNTIRPYGTSRRAESFSTADDRDATVRGRRNSKQRADDSELAPQDKAHESRTSNSTSFILSAN